MPMLMSKCRHLALALFLFLIFNSACSAFDYAAEAQKFDQRIDDLIFVIRGLSSSTIDDSGAPYDASQDVAALNALKDVYREMISAMEKRELKLAQEKRNYIFSELQRITNANGLNYSTKDIERIIGSWSAYELIRLQKEEDAKKQTPAATPKQTPSPQKTPSVTPQITPLKTPTITPKTANTQAPKPHEATSPNLLATLLLAGLMSIIAGLLIHIRRKRRMMYCLIILPLLLFLPYVHAVCVGQQCGEILAIKVWNTEPVTLENGTVLPAGTLLCDSDIERDGFWKDKCTAYCTNATCSGQAIKSSFNFKTEVKIKNNSPDYGYNTLIDGELLVGMHVKPGYPCVYETKVRLLPGETKTYSSDKCRFEYNIHMDPNYPSNDGWYQPRGSCSRSLYCFTNSSWSFHYRCYALMFKIADSGQWAYVAPNAFPGNNNQAVLGKYGIRVLSPNPSNCPGDCVYVNIGEPVTIEASMKNFGVAEVKCIKNRFTSFGDWHKSVDPIAYRRLPNYDDGWDEYFSLAPGESKTKTITFVPVTPGTWRVDWTKLEYYAYDPITGQCVPNPQDYWNNVSHWTTQTGHTIRVRGPDAYLHRIYPPTFYFPPGEDRIEVRTNMTITTAYGTEDFTQDFPLIAEIYYYRPGHMAKETTELTLSKGLNQATVVVDQNVSMEDALGVKTIIAIIKYDPSRDIPGVANDALMNQYMALAGQQGSGTWCGSRCAYAYGALSMPVDFVKFIDLNEDFADFYYFSDGIYYAQLNPNEERSLVLHMENPYTQQTDFTFATTRPDIITFWHGNPATGLQVTKATLPAATSDNFAVSEDYWVKIKAPQQPGIYDINISATAMNVTDKVRIVLTVVLPPQPKADFIAIPRSGVQPLYVDFFDRSTSAVPIVSWFWDFGDGDTNNVQNPEHVYTSDGPFNVTLTVTNSAGLSDSVSKEVYPYSIVSITEVYASDAYVMETAKVGANCTKNVSGQLKVIAQETEQTIYLDNAYVCNSGPVEIGPLENAGIYRVVFRLNTASCSQCIGERYFKVIHKPPEIGTPESPFVALISAIAAIFIAKLCKNRAQATS